MEIARAGPDLGVKARHGFEIVVEHVGLRRHYGLDRALLAQEIRDQHLDRRLRRGGADGPNRRGEMAGAAIVEIIAIHRGHDNVVEPELAYRLPDPLRLMRVELVGPSGRDIAKG